MKFKANVWKFNLKTLIIVMIAGLSFSSNAITLQQKRRLEKKRKQARLERAQQKKAENKKEKEEEKALYSKSLLTGEFTSWGLDPERKNSSIRLSQAWQKFKKKKDVIVAVIDTGIDPNHPFLADNLYIPNANASKKAFGVDFSKHKVSKFTPIDTHGHGTHVSGIIKSVFPDVKILTLKYYSLNASGQDNLNSTIEALRYAVKANVDIINYSGGGPESSREELQILKEAEKKGILVIAAAGNEGANIDIKEHKYFPASYGLKNMVNVTAHDQSVKLLSSSNYGRKTVDISAPGYRIKSSIPHGRAGYLTGTSQATAFVSGVAALIKANFPELSATQIRSILRESASKDLKLMGKTSTGGKLNASAALELATSRYENIREVAMAKKKQAKKKKLINTPSKQGPGKIIYRDVSAKK